MSDHDDDIDRMQAAIIELLERIQILEKTIGTIQRRMDRDEKHKAEDGKRQ